MQNLNKHNKEKKTLFVNTIVLIALVRMSVFFSVFFIFAVFFQFPFFQRCFWIGFPKSKNTKKQSKQNKKQEQKEDKRCKAKQMKYYDSKQSKTTSRPTETKEQLKIRKQTK